MKSKKSKKLEPLLYDKKERLLISFLTAFVMSFVYALFGQIDIYANNIQEFPFVFYDMIGYALLSFVLIASVTTLILYFFKGYLLNILTSLILSTFVVSFVNNNFLTKVTYSGGDASALSDNQIVISGIVDIIIVYAFALLSLTLKKNWKKAVIFLSVLFFGMNAASLVTDFVSKDLVHDNSINCDYVVSNDELLSVSENENIIYILFDRFDTEYFNEVTKKYPGYFDDMDGFTYYDSATAMYTRTFPSATYMMTGVEYTAQNSPQEYFDNAYTTSDFFGDLKKNDYSINLYIDRYYEYSDAKSLLGIADNVEKVEKYTPHKDEIFKYLIKLSFARNFPFLLARVSYYSANDGVVNTLSELSCKNKMYYDNDKKLYESLTNNKLSYTGDKKNYIFLYMHGSHTPHILDENINYSESANGITQTIATSKIVFEYLDQLKEIGAYDNSTIIIAGDHGIPLESDTMDFSKETTNRGITTCMFVKPRNSHGKLVTSSAPVSVENMFSTMIKDADIKTENDYGKSVFDINKNNSVTRHSYQAIYDPNRRKINFNVFEIQGDAKNIDNWTLKEKIKSNYSWY